MFKLIIADDEGKTTVVPLVRDEITIGRREGNTIRLTERNISRRHARLMRNGNGFVVEDLESYNGVRLNGVPVLSPRPLNDGDQLTIGDYQLSFRSDRPAVGAAPPPAQVEPPSFPRLVMLGPPEPGREFPLSEPSIVIGRTDENAIVINHRSISRSHARVVVDGTVCRLQDLDSANGVRVNGEDYKEVELRRGDLVELGTVRLRFVGAGEHYQFDADATIQIDAVPDDWGRERRSPVVPVVIGLLVLAALGGGGYLAYSWQSRDGGQQAGPVTPETPEVPQPSGPSLADIKARARDLIGREQYPAALEALSSVGPTADDEVRRLIRDANSGLENQRMWRAACEDTDQSDHEAVYQLCQRIQEDSPYRSRECCAEAGERLGQTKLAEARRLLRGQELEKALALASALAEDRGLPRTVRDDAGEVRRRAETLLASASVPPTPPGPGPGPRHPGPTKVTPPTPPGPAPTKVRRPADEAIAEATQCVLRNDQMCCVRALEQAERTARVTTMYVDCLHRAGRTDAACRLAERYKNSSVLRQFYEARCR